MEIIEQQNFENFGILEILEILPSDVITVITSFIKQGFQSWVHTCKSLFRFHTRTEVMNRANHFMTIIKFLNPADLSWCNLSDSPNLTIDFILSRPEWDWESYAVFKNPRFNKQDLQRLPDFNENFLYYLWNSNCTFAEYNNVILHLFYHPPSAIEEFTYVLTSSKFSNMSYADIMNRHDEFDWGRVLDMPNKDFSFILKHLDLSRHMKTSFSCKEANLEILEAFISAYKELTGKIAYKVIVKNPNLTMAFIKKHSELDWIGNALRCDAPGISIADILENLDYNWDYTGIVDKQCNPEVLETLVARGKITWEFLITNDKVPFDWIKNKTNNWKGIEARKDVFSIMHKYQWAWNFGLLSGNPNLTREFFLQYLHYNWNWSKISKQPWITFDLVCDLALSPWDFQAMAYNTFDYTHGN